MADIKGWFAKKYDQVRGAIKKFGAEDGALTAAAVSFYSLLTMLPLLLLGVSVLGYVLGSSDRAFGAVVGFFNKLTATPTFVVDVLRGLVNARGVIGGIGIISLLWVGSQFFVTVQTALNDIWEVGRKPGYIRLRLRALSMVLVFGLFLLVSVGSTSLINLLRQPQIGGGLGEVATALISVAAFIVSLIFSIAMFTVVYKWAPDTSVRWRSALYGGVFAGIAWEIAKQLYRLYTAHIANFSNLYGSLGGVVLLILWIYYSSVIMILGGELAYVDEHGAVDRPEEAERMQKAS